ncbi:hypothetical protein [Ornithinimicrobium kibberense]|uniref:hypothetical protein n=1 Tax=Ornithinimicrobium kibberense TaxID=282060 RepID=UPI00361D44ED
MWLHPQAGDGILASTVASHCPRASKGERGGPETRDHACGVGEGSRRALIRSRWRGTCCAVCAVPGD